MGTPDATGTLTFDSLGAKDFLFTVTGTGKNGSTSGYTFML